MPNPFRLSFTRRHWMRLTWRRDIPLPGPIGEHLLTLSSIPGISYERGWGQIDIASTCWNLDSVIELIQATETADAFRRKPKPLLAGPFISLPELKRQPYPWQIEGALFALANSRGLLLCDVMGAGKTLTALLAAESAARQLGRNQPRLIIAPSFTRDVWLRELLDSGLLEDESQFCALRTRNFSDPSWRDDALWYFVHYDVVHAWCTRILASKRGKPVVTILDEVHRLKNDRAGRSRGAHTASAGSSFRMLLTGTPLDNRVHELWHPLSILHGSWSWGSLTQFRRRYAGALRGRFGMIDGDHATHTDELAERIEPFYLRRTLDDIGSDLPPLNRQKITVKLDDKLLSAHNDIVATHDIQELVNAIINGRSSEDSFKILDRLRKLTSRGKFKTTVDYVSSLVEQGESVVVFCWQRETAFKIGNAVSEEQNYLVNTSVVTGATAQIDRGKEVAEFQKRGGLLVATYGALAEGVTLTRARSIVMHDLGWVLSEILQAEARIHRLGQQRGCISTWMVAEDSIDMILARALLRKAEIIEQTLGIDAPAKAVDELDLQRTAGYADMEGWARDLIGRWTDGA